MNTQVHKILDVIVIGGRACFTFMHDMIPPRPRLFRAV
jgi:hypothetical protein